MFFFCDFDLNSVISHITDSHKRRTVKGMLLSLSYDGAISAVNFLVKNNLVRWVYDKDLQTWMVIPV